MLIQRLEKLLEANPEIKLHDNAGIIIPGSVEANVRRKAIMDCLKIAREVNKLNLQIGDNQDAKMVQILSMDENKQFGKISK